MLVLFDGPWWVHYGQLYVESASGYSDPRKAFHGQANGLCGAAAPGHLFIVTGVHTGAIHLRVEEHETEPPLEDSWADVVEASFTPASEDSMLVEWGFQRAENLGLAQVSHRVRYSIHDMDADRELENGGSADSPQGRYLLQLWPEDPSPDRVVRRTSRAAAYWHSSWGGGSGA